MRNPTLRRLPAILMLVAAAGLGLYAASRHNDRIAALMASAEPAAGGSGEAAVGGDFTLTDQDGKTVTDATYDGKYRLVFFGFTACPAICPAGLQKMTKTMEMLDADSEKIQPLFITVDPARDTPAVMKDYLKQYHPRIAGLTGTAEQIEGVQKDYKVYAAKSDDEVTGSYNIDHSSYIYLMDPAGKFVTVFGSDEAPEAIADSVRRHMKAS